MVKQVNIFKSRPILVGSLTLFVLLTCSHHFLVNLGFSNPMYLRILAGLILLFSLAKEIKTFLLDVLEEPRKNFLILCILFFSIAALIFHRENLWKEILLFSFLFFSIYSAFTNQDNDLNNLIANLMICSGVVVSISVFFGLYEYLFLSSNLFHHTIDSTGYDYNDYPYLTERVSFSGLDFNYNFSSYTIIVAQSFLFISTTDFIKNLRTVLTVLFLLSLLVLGAKIAVLFISLVVCNYFIKDKIKRNLLNIILIGLYLFASHIVIAFQDSYEIGSIHYRELLFSIGGIDFILGNYGFLKVAYFIEFKNNFFLPVDLGEFQQTLNRISDPHFSIYTLIYLGGFPLAASVLVFLVKGVYKNIRIIQERYPNFYFCGLIAIITETFVWDAINSLFFWVIILYALTISKNSYLSNNKPSTSINN